MQIQNDNFNLNRHPLSFIAAIAFLVTVYGFFFQPGWFVIGIIVLTLCLFALYVLQRRRSKVIILDLQQQLKALQHQKDVSVQPNDASTYPSYPSTIQGDAQMKRASYLIRTKRYEEARTMLANINNPIANEWVAKIDKIIENDVK